MSTGYFVTVFVLYLGFPVQISTITSSFSIFFTSMVPALQFLISGNFSYEFILLFTFIGSGASFIGSLVVRPFILKRKNLIFLLYVMIQIIVFGSFAVMSAVFSINLAKSATSDGFILGFIPICN